ncbi:MAG: sodium/solute symporter [Candidatus Hydrogenedentes bacterium]|nr:sodium/solute symporter [Candidatus Hydrogenedentota bacterium]
MRPAKSVFRAIVPLILALPLSFAGAARAELAWTDLPELPVPMSGHFVGQHNGALIVAGGSNFPVSPFQGGEKQWLDRIWVLEPGAGAWIDAGALPEPRAYGGTVSLPDGVWLIGGTDGVTCFDSVIRLAWTGELVAVEALEGPAGTLPGPAAFNGAAVSGSHVYAAGGQADPMATEAIGAVWALDLTAPAAGWVEIAAMPGPARMLPVVVGRAEGLYVISGASVHARDDGTAGRTFLSDAYRYDPKRGWQTLTSPPRPLLAAPAVPWGAAHIFVASGDDGSLFEQTPALGDSHPGFPDALMAYHTITDSWVQLGSAPAAYVTTQAVVWNGGMVIPGGEDRPGHRGARVISGVPLGVEKKFSAIDYGTIAIYFALLVAMGVYFSRRENNTEAFFLGGRRIPWWAVGISIFGTSLSSITYLAIPANAYAGDWVGMLSNLGIVLVAPFVVYYYIPHFRKEPISTAYEYLERRFNVAVRVYGSLAFILFQLGRMAIVLYLPAIALSAATGLAMSHCILAMGVLATIYTVLGGIEAVIWTDVIQAVVLLFGALLALYLVSSGIDGGLGAAIGAARDYDKFHMFNWSWDMTSTAVWVCVVGQFFNMLYPYTADQTMVQRYLSTASLRDARRAVWTNAAFTIPVSIIFFGLGTALWAFFKTHPGDLDPNLQNDAILPLFIMAEFPTGLKGIIIAGVFAAAMSTLDSSMNSLASVLVNDYYRRFRRGVTEAQALRLGRILTVLLGAFGTGAALYLATHETRSLFDDYLKFLGMAGAGLSAVVALGMLTRRAHSWPVLAGALAGTGVMLYVDAHKITHFFLYPAAGFLVAFAAGYALSVLIPAPAKDNA